MALDALGGWPTVLGLLADGADLSAEQARLALAEVFDGSATPAQLAAFIVALRIKGETVEEVSGLVAAMLDAAQPLRLPDGTVDIVGTGGSGARRTHALNVSTMASFVAAGAGAVVCKHGNRKASSTSGSFDLLEQLGVTVELDGPAVERCVAQAGIGFAFARLFHPSMRHAAPVRAELGIPTVFNLLGPLSHPGRVRRQVIGVADPSTAEVVLGVLVARGAERAMVVHGGDGLDELTTTTTTTVRELRDGDVTTYELDPVDVGLPRAAPEALRGGSPEENARLAQALFGGAPGPVRDIVVLNAAAGLLVAGSADGWPAAVAAAQASIDEGRARAVLDRLVAVSAEPATS